MKKFTAIQLLLGCALLLVLYSCAPKYGAHFTKTNNFYKSDEPLVLPEEAKPVNTADIKVLEPIEPMEIEEAIAEPKMDQYIVSNEKAVPIAPSPSIKNLVEKHKNRINEIKSSEVESKEMKKELKKAKKKAKKEIKREIKKEIKEFKEHNDSDRYVLMMILAVIIPPLAVGLTYGVVDKFWISLLLTILFFIPGMIYSLIVVHNHFR